MYYCRSLPSYSGQCCWNSECAPLVAYTIVEQNTQVILCENVSKTIDCCLYIVYMYQWQNQHALPSVPGWILVPSDTCRWQEKLLCSVVMALTSKLCAALHGQSYVGSMCDCKPCGSLDLSVLMKILSGVDSDHGTGLRRNRSVNSRSTICPIERRSFWPKTLL